MKKIKNKLVIYNSTLNIMEKTDFLQFLCYLEGFKTKFLDLHWASKLKSEHVLCDSVISEIKSFQDIYAEQGFALFGKFAVGEFTPDLNYSQTIPTALKELLQLLYTNKKLVVDELKFCSLSAILDEMIGKVLQFITVSGYK